MKILMVGSFFHPRGGDTTYAFGLSALLRAAGHEVIPFAMRHPDNDPSPWEARFPTWVDPWGARGLSAQARLLPRMVWSGEAARAIRGVIAEVRPDVAHIHHLHRHLTPSILGPLRDAGVPVVWTVHDAELICPSGTLYTQGSACERCLGGRFHEAITHRCKGDALLPSVAVALEKWVHARLNVHDLVNLFICPSRFMAGALTRAGLPADRVVHLPNFLDLHNIVPGSGPGEGWLYAGRLAPEKGLETLIEAAIQVPEAPLTVCGGGPLEARLVAASRRHPQIRLLGQVPRPQLAALIAAARVVVVPSRWPENYPYAVLEAQAAGRAVVASEIGGIPEQITSGEDGLLVPPGDAARLAEAVSALLADPGRATALGEAGRTRVIARASPAVHADKLLSLYAEALANENSARRLGSLR